MFVPTETCFFSSAHCNLCRTTSEWENGEDTFFFCFPRVIVIKMANFAVSFGTHNRPKPISIFCRCACFCVFFFFLSIYIPSFRDKCWLFRCKVSYEARNYVIYHELFNPHTEKKNRQFAYYNFKWIHSHSYNSNRNLSTYIHLNTIRLRKKNNNCHTLCYLLKPTAFRFIFLYPPPPPSDVKSATKIHVHCRPY